MEIKTPYYNTFAIGGIFPPIANPQNVSGNFKSDNQQ